MDKGMPVKNKIILTYYINKLFFTAIWMGSENKETRFFVTLCTDKVVRDG